MQINIEIEKDKTTLSRWNFKEEALVLYDDNKHLAIPLSRVSGDSIKTIIEKW